MAALVLAEASVLLLRPRDPGPQPVPVEARAYFSARTLDKSRDFRDGQRRIMIAQLAVEGGLLVWLVLRPPGVARRRFPRLARRPVLAGAAAAVALSAATVVATLPLSAVARDRAVDVGLVTQSWPGWAGDVARSAGIGGAIAGAGGALLVFGMRRFGPHWWVPGAGVVVAFGVLVTYAGPIVLDPVFNRFTPLPAGATRTAVLDLARDAGVDVGEVYEVDASRRTTAANAYVAGLGSTKRVVLYDNLLQDFTFEEVRLVVAHELGHVHHRDVPNGLLYLLLVAPAGMFAVARIAERLGARPDARAIPATALSLALMVPAITAVSNQLSRDVERRADAYSMQLTGDPATQIEFQRRIAVQNVSDPDPPAWARALWGTHPTTLERIGAAQALLSGSRGP